MHDRVAKGVNPDLGLRLLLSYRQVMAASLRKKTPNKKMEEII